MRCAFTPRAVGVFRESVHEFITQSPSAETLGELLLAYALKKPRTAAIIILFSNCPRNSENTLKRNVASTSNATVQVKDTMTFYPNPEQISFREMILSEREISSIAREIDEFAINEKSGKITEEAVFRDFSVS